MNPDNPSVITSALAAKTGHSSMSVLDRKQSFNVDGSVGQAQVVQAFGYPIEKVPRKGDGGHDLVDR
jgi:hypothetical protein